VASRRALVQLGPPKSALAAAVTHSLMPNHPSWLAIAVACLVTACGGPPDQAEIVLCKGSRVTVRGARSVLTVGASSLTTRSYQVDGFDFAVELIPRWQRWNGNLGIYRPSAAGGTHRVLEEGQQFFANEEELYQWIDWARQWPGELRYTSDGLLMHWNFGRRDPGGAAPQRFLSVDVAQLMLRGHKPAALEGADDAAFTIADSGRDCVVGAAMHSRFVASEPALLGGRAYAGWARDVMKSHGLTADDVEYVIAHGKATAVDGMTGYLPPADAGRSRNFRVIVEGNGKVIRVFF
jgi:hypothetical protein